MSTTSSASPRWWPRPKRGRKPQNISKIPFIDHWPLILKNRISTRKGQISEAPCLKETLAFITCLKDHNNSHELCYKEGEMVQRCFSNHTLQQKENIQKKKTTQDFQPEKNVKNMDPEQLNRFLSHFPHRLKKY